MFQLNSNIEPLAHAVKPKLEDIGFEEFPEKCLETSIFNFQTAKPKQSSTELKTIHLRVGAADRKC